MGIIGEIKKELMERIIGKFKSIMYSSLYRYQMKADTPGSVTRPM